MLEDAETLEEAVFQALGAASVCWEGVPSGIFESDKCKAIGDELMDRIREEMKRERENILDVS